MQVIGQHDECGDLESMGLPRAGDRFAQRFDMVNKQRLAPLQDVDREEPASSRNECAAIIRHEVQRNT